MKPLAAAALALTLVMTIGCRQSDPPADGASGSGATPVGTVTRAPFGTMPDGTDVELFTLSNENGVELRAISYGGTILSLRAPDREGVPGDVVLGYETLEAYLEESPYFGAIIGRYGNRLGDARFQIDGVEHAVTANDGANHLHGGARGFDKVAWDAEPFESAEGVGVRFHRVSPAGEEGYPGTLTAEVTYTLTEAGEVIFDYLATTDAPTPVNLTQHSYFNLAGDGSGDVLAHRLTIPASRYTPVDEGLIPTGEMAPVEGTPFDFRSPTAIGARIADDHPQLHAGGGYDHNFVLDREGVAEGELALAAKVEEPVSGRTLEILTTEPGIQFYSGNFLDGTLTGKNDVVYEHRFGICLETQHFPDSPNQPAFPNTILRPGEEYRSRTILRFGVMP